MRLGAARGHGALKAQRMRPRAAPRCQGAGLPQIVSQDNIPARCPQTDRQGALQMFPKDNWYVAALPADIDGRPLGRRICGLQMVFFRGPEGQATALEDWCPHRGAPLSLGRVVDGRLVCGYHGLEMGHEGRTVAMPGQRVRGFAPIAAYPVVERHGFVWVWPGDASKADPALVPDLHWAGHPDWAYGGGLYHIACDYRLMVDNLMDLTHETYVHADSIGQPEIEDVAPVTRVEGDHVITSRVMHNISAPPFWRMALRSNGLADDVPVDRWQICHFTPPSHVMIEVGVAHAGHGGIDAPADKKAGSIVVDFITPETEHSIWYFWGMARNFKPHDKALTASIREGQGKIFAEDQKMLELQQRNHLLHPTRKLLGLNTDAGGVQARRIVDRIVAAERAREAAGVELAGATR
jgi:vanillate O-demethylase monooxygenase subunit